MKSKLDSLGYNKWCQNNSYDQFSSEYVVLRVTEVNKNSCVVSNGDVRIQAELSGKFVFDSQDIEDFPATGDWVEAEVFDNNSFAIIHNVLPRKTLLKRKMAGKTVGFQLIAANVDVGIVVQAANKLNLNLVERYLVMLNNSNIEPLVVITKIDLLDNSEIDVLKSKLERIHCKCLLISNLNVAGFWSGMDGVLVAGSTYCLLGSSGVGKSTILNNFLQREVQKTAEVRAGDGKGKHTTVSRQLLKLDSGAIFIDTPGMRELANFDVGGGIESTFDEFGKYEQQCRFTDCSHTHENGCAVRIAVEKGDISHERYNNYLKLKKETEFYDMQYHDKRQKDKKLSKVKKNFKDRHRRK